MRRREAENTSEIRDTDIVVGVDGSPSSRAALRWALEQARRTGARVQAVSAWEFPAYYGMGAVSSGVPTCCSRPRSMTAMRSPRVIASTWSWVT